MKTPHPAYRLRAISAGLLCMALAIAAMHAVPARADTPRELRAKYASLRDGPQTPFGLPLYIDSRQTDDTLSGSVHSEIGQPFDVVKRRLREPRQWCEILILHPNVKGCSARESERPSLEVVLGSMEQTAQFAFSVMAESNDFLDIGLHAARGPMGTTDYRFRVQATPLDGQRTLLRLAYSHGYGMRAKLAMETYFATMGRGKVGFTVVDRTPAGKPIHVDGLRGGMERNAMRYYLAIQAQLGEPLSGAGDRLERGLQSWLAKIDRYPLQLKEEAGYADRKREEIRRFEAQGGTLAQARAERK